MLGGFISEKSSSTVASAVCRVRFVSKDPEILIPATTALISSRKSVRNDSGSGELLATLAINPAIKIWQAIIRPFNSSIVVFHISVAVWLGIAENAAGRSVKPVILSNDQYSCRLFRNPRRAPMSVATS